MTIFNALRTVNCRLAAVLCAVVGVAGVGASPAFAEEGWWHLTVQSRPGIMKEGAGRGEVQELTVSANGGEFVLLQNGLPSTAVKFDATDAELQTALDVIYGVGNVEVTGGPGDLAGSKPYRLTFVNGLYGRQVAPIEVAGESVGGVELMCEGSPCPGNVSVREVEESRPDGQIAVVAANLGDASINGGAVPVTIETQLPAGLEAVHIYGESGEREGPVQCSLARLRCQFAEALPADEQIELFVDVVVKPGAKSGA